MVARAENTKKKKLLIGHSGGAALVLDRCLAGIGVGNTRGQIEGEKRDLGKGLGAKALTFAGG